MRSLKAFVLAFAAACGPEVGVSPPVGGGGGIDSGFVGGCPSPPPDSDGDGISDRSEGGESQQPIDTDQDGAPDFRDSDSDGDGLLDRIEGRNGNPCNPPHDADGDGRADFQDTDSDSPTDATVPDREEAGSDPLNPRDTDGDGTDDFVDADNDGDGIFDAFELTPQGQTKAVTSHAAAPDTDQDGTADYLDDDSDGDTLGDRVEGQVDTDGDLSPNYRDTDSDGDCISDGIEGATDSDMDSAADFVDKDSDADGLLDTLEDKNCSGTLDACETSRLKADTDGDNVTDLIEHQACAIKTPAEQAATMCACDGANAGSNPRTRGDFVFVVDYQKPPVPQVSTLDLGTDVSQADVVFAIDTTGSMGVCAQSLATHLANTVVPGVRARVSNAAFGVVDFKDFTDPYVVAYRHRIQTVNTPAGVMSVQGALSALTGSGGNDNAEAGWEALYSIAGGPALSGAGSGGTVWNSVFNLAATFPTTPTPGETQGPLHGAGFRPGSVPIVVAIADANFHDRPGTAMIGEDGIDNYGPGTDCASGCTNVSSRATTIARLNTIGAHVVGLAVNGLGASGDSKTRFRFLAQATGAIVSQADFGPARPAGCAAGQCCTGAGGAGEAPTVGTDCALSYTIERGSGNCPVSDAIVSGIAALAKGLRFDMHVEASDVDPNTVDNFMLRLEPNLTGVGPAAMCITMTPTPLQDNFTGPKATAGPDGTLDTFPGIGGAVRVCFDVIPKTNTTVMNTGEAQIFRARLQVRGRSGMNLVNLGTPREVFFLVPPVIKNGPIG